MAATLADQLLLQTLGQLHIVAGFHGVLTTALGAGAQVGSIAEHHTLVSCTLFVRIFIGNASVYIIALLVNSREDTA